jgi:hypothetical protein
MLVEGFPVSLGVALGVVAAVCATFALSLPMLRSPIDRTMLAAPAKPVGVARVRRVFRDYGVRFHYTSHPSPGVVVLGVTPPPYAPGSLTVAVSHGRFTARYGGTNSLVRKRVQAAVAALSR